MLIFSLEKEHQANYSIEGSIKESRLLNRFAKDGRTRQVVLECRDKGWCCIYPEDLKSFFDQYTTHQLMVATHFAPRFGTPVGSPATRNIRGSAFPPPAPQRSIDPGRFRLSDSTAKHTSHRPCASARGLMTLTLSALARLRLLSSHCGLGSRFARRT